MEDEEGNVKCNYCEKNLGIINENDRRMITESAIETSEGIFCSNNCKKAFENNKRDNHTCVKARCIECGNMIDIINFTKGNIRQAREGERERFEKMIDEKLRFFKDYNNTWTCNGCADSGERCNATDMDWIIGHLKELKQKLKEKEKEEYE